MRRPIFAAVFASIFVLSIVVAPAQHHAQKFHRDDTQLPAPDLMTFATWSLSVRGAFRSMVQKQDYSPKIQLHMIIRQGATEAVGAVAGLRGEITAIDGRLLVTYGTPCPGCAQAGDAHATLLASASIRAWYEPVPLPRALVGKDLDEFIVDRAKAAGLDVGKPFPVRLKGQLISVRMHVVRSPNAGFTGHGSAHPMADQEDIAAEYIDGDVVGFYAPGTLQGIITHPGESFHYHWVDIARTRTAHLDAFGMAEGAMLMLPRPSNS